MKKIFLISALSSLILSCNSGDKKTTDETKDKNEAGVQNVNGNIPDTTNAINLSTHKNDSAVVKDSSK